MIVRRSPRVSHQWLEKTQQGRRPFAVAPLGRNWVSARGSPGLSLKVTEAAEAAGSGWEDVVGRTVAQASGRPGLAGSSSRAGPVTVGETLGLSEPCLLGSEVVVV